MSANERPSAKERPVRALALSGRGHIKSTVSSGEFMSVRSSSLMTSMFRLQFWEPQTVSKWTPRCGHGDFRVSGGRGMIQHDMIVKISKTDTTQRAQLRFFLRRDAA